jgi:hypothetical protein
MREARERLAAIPTGGNCDCPCHADNGDDWLCLECCHGIAVEDLRRALDALERVEALANELELHDDTGDAIDEAVGYVLQRLRATLSGRTEP